jgi:Ca2+-binding EF-hand superfamily protein
MGSSSSKKIGPPRLKKSEITEFSKETLFAPKVIEKLHYHFYRMARSQNDDGVIDLEEFAMSIHKTPTKSPIIEGLFNLFDANHDGAINFHEFINGLSTFNKSDAFGNTIHESKMTTAAKLIEQIEVSLRIIKTVNKKIYLADLQSILISAIKEIPSMRVLGDAIESIVKESFENEEHEQDDKGIYLTVKNYTRMVVKNPRMLKWLSSDIERISQETGKKVRKNKPRCLSV